METLDDSKWDVVIVGTGIQQSLLALALSRSNKKVLHVDQNDFYGGAEAAFSLQEAEKWVEDVKNDPRATSIFSHASVVRAAQDDIDGAPKLSPSRSYSLALAPDLIYTRSNLLSTLVSAKVHRQLEFLAVGSWWIYSAANSQDVGSGSSGSSRGRLNKIPSGREDVFADEILNARAKRGLMKFLRFIMDYEEQREVWEPHKQSPFLLFLSEQFKMPKELHQPLAALTLSAAAIDEISTEYALPRIARHMRSIGVFGAGFGSILPKWGGLSEIVQVACRAGAVGGAVYVLGKGISGWTNQTTESQDSAEEEKTNVDTVQINLEGGETISASWLVGSIDDLRRQMPEDETPPPLESGGKTVAISHSVSIVSTPLTSLFPALAEGAPSPAGAVVVFPPEAFSTPDAGDRKFPVNIFVHSSDSGECPQGQYVIYATTALTGEPGVALLDEAVQLLLQSSEGHATAQVLWAMRYEQSYSVSETAEPDRVSVKQDKSVVVFPRSPHDLALEDSVMERVRRAWQLITARDEEAGEFMVFEDREGTGDDEGEEE